VPVTGITSDGSVDLPVTDVRITSDERLYLPVTGITSDGSVDLPVAGVRITSDRLVKITVTSMHPFGCG
jgi:hypothetical protein